MLNVYQALKALPRLNPSAIRNAHEIHRTNEGERIEVDGIVHALETVRSAKNNRRQGVCAKCDRVNIIHPIKVQRLRGKPVTCLECIADGPAAT